jgi:predicted regulator of Ras-like GTPase activity (Roadblock/LC7/MglB family)
MSQLSASLERLRSHEGVEHLILLGEDGLVIEHAPGGGAELEGVAARVPGVAAACSALGRSARSGTFRTAVLEFEGGVAILVALSPELLLTALVRAEVGFAPLLRELRREGRRLAELL